MSIARLLYPFYGYSEICTTVAVYMDNTGFHCTGKFMCTANIVGPLVSRQMHLFWIAHLANRYDFPEEINNECANS
jgi:hypothetical protein